ncbi:hypothetical protein [Streptomyces sp. NPDC056672]|uniref:hypothetical protein n=1 Tax=Streptomyces sp. NPDC056672 TaxID=3345906 RepID=UPI003690362A
MSLWPLNQLSLSASTLLDKARAEDCERWPHVVAAEKRADEQTFTARCVASEAERVLFEAEHGEEAVQSPSAIPLPSPSQWAALAPIAAGTDFLTDLLDDPESAIERLHEMEATGEFTANRILDEAADTAVLSGLLGLREAQRESDPSTAAEKCLVASRHFALAVSLASADVEAPTV